MRRLVLQNVAVVVHVESRPVLHSPVGHHTKAAAVPAWAFCSLPSGHCPRSLSLPRRSQSCSKRMVDPVDRPAVPPSARLRSRGDRRPPDRRRDEMRADTLLKAARVHGRTLRLRCQCWRRAAPAAICWRQAGMTAAQSARRTAVVRRGEALAHWPRVRPPHPCSCLPFQFLSEVIFHDVGLHHCPQ